MGVFDWFAKTESQDVNSKSRMKAQRPKARNLTEEFTVNGDLTRGLYHNQYPGLKLAGALAFAPIFVPAAMMGIPVPTSEDEKTREALETLVKNFSQSMQQIHIQSHREGTVWVFPYWSSKQMRLNWELIQDDTVSDIIRDLDTGEIQMVITTEQLKVQTGENKQETLGRVRYFSKKELRTVYSGAKSEIRIVPNKFGIMPIPFSNNADGDQVRGHSDYERIISDLKNYHDIDQAWTTLLAKFSVKMIQEISVNVDTWIGQNGIDLNAFDISTVDVIFNKFGTEKTEFVFPQGAHDAYGKKLEFNFYKLVEGSGIPEIAWGIKTQGNHASAEEQMGTLIKFVEAKREQKDAPYKILFQNSITLISAATMQKLGTVSEVTWNNMDAISDDVKSQIFQRFADGISKMILSGAITMDQAHKLWVETYPRATEKDFDKWRAGMDGTAKFSQFVKASFTEALQATGAD